MTSGKSKFTTAYPVTNSGVTAILALAKYSIGTFRNGYRRYLGSNRRYFGSDLGKSKFTTAYPVTNSGVTAILALAKYSIGTFRNGYRRYLGSNRRYFGS